MAKLGIEYDVAKSYKPLGTNDLGKTIDVITKLKYGLEAIGIKLPGVEAFLMASDKKMSYKLFLDGSKADLKEAAKMLMDHAGTPNIVNEGYNIANSVLADYNKTTKAPLDDLICERQVVDK
ncbi:MAG: hypothetical protein ABIB43_01890 [archaeon]